MVPTVTSPEGQALPFIFAKPHRVKGEMVPEPMLYPSLEMLDASIRHVPKGGNSSLAEMRAEMARAHQTASTCPVTTQRLFHDIAAAAFEAWQHGQRDTITPFWRMVDPDRPSARHLPGGVEFIRARRAEEQAGY
jgi:hypothetical protein